MSKKLAQLQLFDANCETFNQQAPAGQRLIVQNLSYLVPDYLTTGQMQYPL